MPAFTTITDSMEPAYDVPRLFCELALSLNEREAVLGLDETEFLLPDGTTKARPVAADFNTGIVSLHGTDDHGSVLRTNFGKLNDGIVLLLGQYEAPHYWQWQPAFVYDETGVSFYEYGGNTNGHYGLWLAAGLGDEWPVQFWSQHMSHCDEFPVAVEKFRALFRALRYYQWPTSPYSLLSPDGAMDGLVQSAQLLFQPVETIWDAARADAGTTHVASQRGVYYRWGNYAAFIAHTATGAFTTPNRDHPFLGFRASFKPLNEFPDLVRPDCPLVVEFAFPLSEDEDLVEEVADLHSDTGEPVQTFFSGELSPNTEYTFDIRFKDDVPEDFPWYSSSPGPPIPTALSLYLNDVNDWSSGNPDGTFFRYIYDAQSEFTYT